MLPFNRGLSRSAQKGAPYSDAEVWMVAEGVVEPVGEIGRTDHQRELDDLPFVVILPQLFERAGAHSSSAARDAVGIQDRGFLFFVK
jgi:hypothetical protein